MEPLPDRPSLIPRYAGDTDDPRGGVRWIMPEKAPYWKREKGLQNGEARDHA
ncbi:hypothetical protein GMST_00020 [Geomonas silvestris]|uniref:Uncharacterized protein n=1 Tax=Geomonas silvestris TaxID=2740184 RepID=A0A6V8MCI6_9BACT|nr:hypothetical protein GMST_00020 [Geomonas silvestris]